MSEKTMNTGFEAVKDSLVITDPCYILKEEDWNCLIDFSSSDRMVDWLKEKGFTDFILTRTGIGDWSNHVTVGDTIIGDFAADSGLVIVCLLEDLSSYREDFFEKCTSLEQNGCLAIVPKFTGVVSLMTKRGVAIILGKREDEIIFYTDNFEEELNEEEKITLQDLKEVEKKIEEYEKKFGRENS